MITPQFTVSQDDEFIHINIKISNIRFSAKAIEMVVEENLFVFSLPPYYLRLRFPNSLIEDERAHSEFVSKDESIKIRVPKLTKGEFFQDLDLTAKLLARINEPTAIPATDLQKQQKKGPLIEELDDEASNITTKGEAEHYLRKIGQEAEDFNWEVEQKLPELNMPGSNNLDSLNKQKYGFNNQYADMVELSLSNGNDINELSSPETMSSDDRVMERLIKENIKFDPEYYANDYLTYKYTPNDTALTSVLQWKSDYKKVFLKFQKEQKEFKELHGGEEQSQQLAFPNITFTQDEQDKMADLPKKSYLIDDPKPLYYTIVCLLYSYCYELRSNEGDLTVESGWAVGKLTPQISCLDSQLIQSNNETEKNVLKIIVVTMARRSLGFPLYRNFELIKQAFEDTYFILRCGKRGILKALMATRELFRFHDVYYVYCKVLLDDLCSWVLRADGCNERVLRNLAHELKKQSETLTKQNVVFEKILAVDGMENEEKEVDIVDEEPELEFVNLLDIEELAEEAYLSQFQL